MAVSVSELACLFNEELGLIVETEPRHTQQVLQLYHSAGVTCTLLGHSSGTGPQSQVSAKLLGVRNVIFIASQFSRSLNLISLPLFLFFRPSLPSSRLPPSIHPSVTSSLTSLNFRPPP